MERAKGMEEIRCKEKRDTLVYSIVGFEVCED